MKNPNDDIILALKDKTVETTGFSGIINEQRETNDLLKEVIVKDEASSVIEKLEEVKSASLISNKLLKEIKDKEDIVIPQYPKEIRISNFPETKAPIVNVETPVVNVPAPVVNVPAPVVNVPAPVVNVDTKEVVKELKNISSILTEEEEKEETTKKVLLVDEDGSFLDIKKLFKILGDKILSKSGNDGHNIVGVSGGLSTANAETLINGGKSYAIRVDTASEVNIMYIGKAVVGTTGEQSIWQIQKIDKTGAIETAVIKWANGNDSYVNIWDNRTSLTYL